MSKDFNKANFSEETLNSAIAEQRDYFTKNLKPNYSLISVTGSNVNGLSIYVNVLRDGEAKEFQFRISDHENGNGFGISEGQMSYQLNNGSLNDMYAFYGEMPKNEARILFLKNEIANHPKKQGAGYESLIKQLEKLTK